MAYIILKNYGNFAEIIDNSGDYRQEWFDFKKMRYFKYVKRQIKLIKNE